MSSKDVTRLVEFSYPDEESLPITKCVCGARFDLWDFVIDAEWEKEKYSCPVCNTKLCWTQTITVYQVEE